MIKLLPILIALLLFACDRGGKPDTPVLDTLLIIHTNDHHGAIFPSSDGLGGLARRAALFEALKKQYKNTLVLDAGDINMGSVLSNLFKAEPDILAYNLLLYHAVVLGNHEFDNTPEILRKQIDAADFKFISANVDLAEVSPYMIKNFGNLIAAVIGITTTDTPKTSSFGKNYVFSDEIKTAREFVELVRKYNPDITILLTHVGIDKSKTLADSVAGIDIIIDGHSHTRMDTPEFVNNVPIVSAWEWGKEVGQARFIFENGEIKSFDWQKTIIDTSFTDNLKMVNLLQPYVIFLSDSIAEAAEIFPFHDEDGNRLPRMGESAIGNLVCDAVMFFVEKSEKKADFALMNGGNIRSGLPKGKITKENVFEVLPFENFLEIIELSGSQLLELLDFLAEIAQKSGAFPQISKISFSREEIELERKYFVATNDWLSSGGDGYLIFENREKQKTGILLTDILIEYLQSFNEPVKPILDGRKLPAERVL